MLRQNISNQCYFRLISIHNPASLGQPTISKLYKHIQHKAQIGNMDLLILAPSDLFQIDVSYFYKLSTKELNICLYVPMVKPMNQQQPIGI
jgi:hypothetical protein